MANYDAREVLPTPGSGAAGTGTTPVLPEQGFTGLMALEGMTSHPAAAAGDKTIAGRIAAAFRADLTAFAVDPVAAPGDGVGEAPIRLTMVGGTVTHQA